jgi:tyrosine-protein kinase Etk/Wzc
MEEREPQDITLLDYVRIVWSRRWMVGLITSSVVAFTIFFTLRMKPVYESQTSLLIESNDAGALSIFDPTGLMKQKFLINNECELLRSRSLAQRVLDRARREGWTPSKTTTEDVDWVAALRSRLTVSSLKDADVITIKMTAGDPEEAAYFANLFADEYRNQNISQNRGELSGVRQFLEEQLQKVEERLTQSEEELRRFKSESGLVSLSDEVESMVRQLAEFESAENSALVDKRALESRLAYVTSQLEDSRRGLVEDLDDSTNPLVVQLRDQLVALQTERTSLLVRGAKPSTPQIVELESKIEEARSNLAAETQKLVDRGLVPGDPLVYNNELVEKILGLRTELEAASARASDLHAVVQEFNSKLQTLPDKELELARRTREYTVDENTYLMMKQKYEEVRISEAGEIGNVRIIDTAIRVLDPVRPNKRLNALLGLLVGLGLGLALSFFLEYLDTSLRSIEEVEKKLNTVVLGAVSRWDRPDRGEVGADESSRLITMNAPRSAVAEAYRTVRTNIGFAAVGAPLRTIVVTSSGPKEGKSTTASNLAVTMAQSGKRVLLLDADLRRPVLHKIFGIDRDCGLTDHLVGTVELSEIIHETAVDGLFVVSSGSLPPNPSELLGSESMREVLDHLQEEFDLIIIDTPPVMAVTDALVLIAEVDGVIMIVEAGTTAEQVAVRTRQLIAPAARRFLGVVLNNLDLSRGYGYGRYGGYHYHYQYHYQSETEPAPGGRRGARRIARSMALLVVFFIAVAAAMWSSRDQQAQIAASENLENLIQSAPDGTVAQR